MESPLISTIPGKHTIGKLKIEHTAFMIIDLQERLMPVISNREEIIENTNKLIKGAEILGVPVIVSEQYPKGLGHTVPDIQLAEDQEIIEKICFSCMLSEGIVSKIKGTPITSLVIAGIESHICVFKTALDALSKNFDVHIVADAIGSRKDENRKIAIERLRHSGAFIESTEMVLFQLMDEAGNDQFKQISKLIR